MHYKVKTITRIRQEIEVEADSEGEANNIASDKILSIMKRKHKGLSILVATDGCQELESAQRVDIKPSELKENAKVKRKQRNKV